MRPKLAMLTGLTTCCLWAPAALEISAAQGYEHFIVGNAADVVTSTDRLAVLHGGGSDLDEIFVRMGAAAGGGDFVVLRASGTDAYNPYIYELCGCDSVETIVFKNRQAAFDPVVISRVRNAEAVWLAGGDQSDYVTYWKGTPIEARAECPRRSRADRRPQRRHGGARRVRVFGVERQQSDVGRRPGESVPPRPHAGARFSLGTEAGKRDHRPASGGAGPHGTYRDVPRPPGP